MGQSTAILRLWPQLRGAGDQSGAEASLAAGASITLLASLTIGALLCLFALTIQPLVAPGQPVSHFLGAALLILPMALSEYNSSALRAQGSLWTALLPRDIYCRLALPLIVLGLYWLGVILSGPAALALSAGLLPALLGPPPALAGRQPYPPRPRRSHAALRSHWQRWGGLSIWLLLGALLETLTRSADIILVRLMLDLESSGLYFNAFRTAG